MLPGILSETPFVPQTLESLTLGKVFPSPLPEAAYAKMLREYEAVTDVITRRIVYESDGLKVTGLSCLPTQIVEKSHPLLIYNRGGAGEFGKLTVLSALRSMIPFARARLLVFASNYRGNDGGEGKEEFGGVEVDDVLNLLAIARRHTGWDGRNTFLLGHSRGAMMTHMTVRRGANANAVVAVAGIADLRQSGEERPEMEERVFQRLIPGEGVQREAAYDARSPRRWAEELTVPTLLLHGDGDTAVDAAHSVRLAEVLAQAGNPHELHIYPGGNHALLRHWDDVLARSLAWFERYRR